MKYEFTLKDKGFKRIVFALMLDKKKFTERIVIGEPDQILLRLERSAGNVYYDKVRPLGSMLINFEQDKDREWNINAYEVSKTYPILFTTNKMKMKALQSHIKFLQDKISGNEPSAIYAAIHTWEEYMNCYNLNHGAEQFIERTAALYRPFFRKNKLWEDENILQSIKPTDSQVELWYPAAKRPFECIVGFPSFIPLITYSLHKIEEWGFVFQKCKVCDSDFLARSRHYELCSDQCRKIKMSEAKKEFDERAKGDKLENFHESAYYHWYNRQRKLKRNKTTDLEKIIVFNTAFDEYKKESKRLKAEVKRGNMSLADFTSWLEQQKDVADDLM